MRGRKLRILEAFATIVAKHGINKTTMRDVAEQTGYSIGTIYNEFVNKEALIDGLFDQKKLEIETCLRDLSDTCQASGEMRLRRFILGYIKAFNQRIREDVAFAELVKEACYFRYIGLKTMDFNQFVQSKLLIIIEDILNSGVEERVFRVAHISRTAKLVLNAFTVYLLPSLILEKEFIHIYEESECMLEFILKALSAK
ncbi:TetR/AcrR family transcriptional regulator [Anaerosinus massiliensis]|uniref:TetR/AcrR family transcriptional regulator n=1 Tax=Massilibacillus massiliensis TaxID=1806837 RepID=UPI000DA5ED63|nr:TetR/AcrR family transcriptional regulator [Massilibacillus massiliensis]